jgi:hypothetical protein
VDEHGRRTGCGDILTLHADGRISVHPGIDAAHGFQLDEIGRVTVSDD